MAASEQLAALIAERDKLWQVVEALLAPQPPAVPRSLSPSGQAAPSFTLFSLDGVGDGPSPPASPRSVRPAQATSPTTASKVVDDAGGHVRAPVCHGRRCPRTTHNTLPALLAGT